MPAESKLLAAPAGPPAPSSSWITGRAACRVLGDGFEVGATVLQRLALLGEVRFRLEPGYAPRYHRGDCEKAARAFRERRRPARKSGRAGRDAPAIAAREGRRPG
jgi:hypothetical protein